MSELVNERSKSSEIKSMAAKMIKEQTSERDKMQGWQRKDLAKMGSGKT